VTLLVAGILACAGGDRPAGAHAVLVYSGNVDGDIEPCG
jgi:hypothetical protein